MDSIQFGFFAVSPTRASEIEQLHAAYIVAADEHHEDYVLRGNELYREAAASSAAKCVFRGRSPRSACTEIVSFCQRQAWLDRDQSFFNPDDCRAFAHGVRELERRMGSADPVIAAIARRAGARETDVIAEVYLAFRQVLEAAAAAGDGFVWAVYDDGAEARLAAERERRRQRQEAIARGEIRRLSPDEMQEDLIEMRRILEEVHAREERALGDRRTAHLVVVPDERARELDALGARADALFDANRPDDALEHVDKIEIVLQELFREHPYTRQEFDPDGFAALEAALARHCKKAYRDWGIYTVAQARTLLEALARRRLRRRAGARVLDSMVAAGVPEDVAGETCERLERTLAQAVESGRGVVTVLDPSPHAAL